MVYTGYPSSGPRSGAAATRHSLSSLCRCGSSDPLFPPHPVPRKRHPACPVHPELRRGPGRERSEGSPFFASLSTSSSVFSVSVKNCPLTRISASDIQPSTINSSSPSSFLATRLPRVSRSHSPLATIPLRITSFADHCPLTLIESNLYKRQGREWGTHSLPDFSLADKCATRSKFRKPITFMRLPHNFSTPRVGRTSCSAHSASLRYPFPSLASPLRVNAGVPNEP
jgi:hypothetical protein